MSEPSRVSAFRFHMRLFDTAVEIAGSCFANARACGPLDRIPPFLRGLSWIRAARVQLTYMAHEAAADQANAVVHAHRVKQLSTLRARPVKGAR